MSMFRRRLLMQQALRVPAFPEIPGLIARYSTRGLTNEEMAKTNVWKDLTGNGHDITLHNFAWSGMSGVGGYYLDFSTFASDQSSKLDMEVHSDKVVFTNIDNIPGENINLHGIKNLNAINDFTFRISGMKDGEECYMSYRAEGSSTNTNIIRILSDGEFSVDIPSSAVTIIFEIGNIKNKSNRRITIEQLPLYPNALVSDGVDDYGICENFPILTKEEGYTVVAVRKWLDSTLGRTRMFISDAISDSNRGSLKVENLEVGASSFTATSLGEKTNISLSESDFIYQTSTSYCGDEINVGDINTNPILYILSNYGVYDLIQLALYDLIIYSRDLTEEEINQLRDYFYQRDYDDMVARKEIDYVDIWDTYDKTNDSVDRDTLVGKVNGLTFTNNNFAYAGGSGYGKYSESYINRWADNQSRATSTRTHNKINVTAVYSSIIAIWYQSSVNEEPRTISSCKIKVSGLTDGQTIRYSGSGLDTNFDINEDGIYELPSFEFLGSGNVYGFSFLKNQESCNITIEQIPEYPGALVYDGVDDCSTMAIFDDNVGGVFFSRTIFR